MLDSGTLASIPLTAPVTASYDDWTLGLSTRVSPHTILTREAVLSIWQVELDETLDWGAMVTTVLHPQCSGRRKRLKLLREFLEYGHSCADVWTTTGEKIASWFTRHKAKEAASR